MAVSLALAHGKVVRSFHVPMKVRQGVHDGHMVHCCVALCWLWSPLTTRSFVACWEDII